MKPRDRLDWIESYLRERGSAKAAVDVLDADFVAAYIEATDAKFYPQMYGAHKCPQLGRDLSLLNGSYHLRRSRIGIEGMAGMGFPRWVWSYRLAVA